MTAKEINALREYANDIGLQFPTDKKMVQDNPKFSNIIVPAGVKDAGKVMTYEEMEKFNTKYGGKVLTKAEYDVSIKQLESILQGYGTTAELDNTLYNHNVNRISALNETMGTDYDISKLSKNKLNSIMKQASTIVNTIGSDKGNYTFFEILQELLDSEIND